MRELIPLSQNKIKIKLDLANYLSRLAKIEVNKINESTCHKSIVSTRKPNILANITIPSS